MKYATAYQPGKRNESPAGEKFEITYEMDIDENGHKTLKKSERLENVYEIIQESLEETKIENIIRRAVGGDPTALSTMHGEYIDATNAPASLAEAQRMIIQATEEFFKLPVEIREKFDHSPEMYINELGSQSWMDKIGYKAPEKEEETEGKVNIEHGEP